MPEFLGVSPNFMTMKNFKYILFFLAISFAQVGFSQEDSLAAVNDSLNNIKLQEFNDKLAEIEAQRVQDSLKRIELEKELGALKTTDNLKKEELEAQLNALNDKEAQRIADKKAQINAIKLDTKGFPVLGFFDDTLFVIYAKLGSFSPKDRAIAIGDRIKNLESNFNGESDTLYVSPSEGDYDIMFGESIVMSVTENDALWENTDGKKLAEKYAQIINNEIKSYQSETSTYVILKRIGLVLLVLIIMFFALKYVVKLFKWIAKKISDQEGKKLKGIKIKNYTLFDEKREVGALLFVNRILKWFVIIVLLYIMLPILFGIFPWTRGLSGTLFGYVLNPIKKIASSFYHYLPNLITIIVIIIVFRYVMKGIYFLKTEVENGNLKLKGFYPDWANPTYQIIKVLLFAFMVIVIFPYLPGSDSPVFQGVSVLLGFLLTFGSAGSLSNIVAGLVLTYMRLFTIGDRVKIGEVFGDVIEKSLLVTRVRTPKNEIISIPNSTVMSSHTINYSADAPANGLIVHSSVTIGYDVPWKNVHEALIEAAQRTTLILDTPVPFVLQTGLEDFYVAYEVNGYVREVNKQAKIYSDLHQNIQDVFNERGIEILSPHYRAARDGNQTTIPADYLDKNYEAPSFKVKLDKEK